MSIVTPTTPSTPATAAPPEVEALRDLLPGRVITPIDPAWQHARLGWSVNVDQRPAAVVTVSDPDDVALVTRHARSTGLTVSAQPVGHGASTSLSGTVLLRTGALAECSVDPVRRVARVGAGLKWQPLLDAAGEHGLTGLCGSSSDPSVAGFCLGGGLSWFSRAHGLAANSVRAVDLVDADGQCRRVDAEHDPELFWAVRGGGGEFGIVTAMELDLFPADPLYGGRLLWPIEQAAAVVDAFRRIVADAPDELSVWLHLLRFPPLPTIPEPLRGGQFVSLDFTYLGSAEAGAALMAPARAVGAAPILDTGGLMPVARLAEIVAEPTEPMPSAHWSTLLDDLDDATVASLLEVAGPGANCPLLIVQLRHLGGALRRPAATAGSAGGLDAPFELLGLGVPMVPELADAVQAGLTELASAVRPVDSGRAPYTFLSADEPPDRAYPPDVLARLRRIKAARDPQRVIGGNHPL